MCIFTCACIWLTVPLGHVWIYWPNQNKKERFQVFISLLHGASKMRGDHSTSLWRRSTTFPAVHAGLQMGCISRHSSVGSKASVVLLYSHLFPIQARTILSTENSRGSQRLLKMDCSGFYPDYWQWTIHKLCNSIIFHLRCTEKLSVPKQ